MRMFYMVMVMMALMLVFLHRIIVFLNGNGNEGFDDSVLHGNGNYDFDAGTITSMMSMKIMAMVTTMKTTFSGGGCMGRCLRMQMLHPAQCNSLC